MSDLGDKLGAAIQASIDAYVASLIPDPVTGVIPVVRGDIFKAFGNAIHDAAPIIDGQNVSATHGGTGVVVSIPHTLKDSAGAARAFRGFVPTNGVKCHHAPTQTSPTTQIDLIVDAWYETFHYRAASSQTSINATGLNGDLHKQYEIFMRVLEGNIGIVDLRPNGIAPDTTQSSYEAFNGGAGSVNSSSHRIYSGSADAVNLRAIWNVETGNTRLLLIDCAGEDGLVLRRQERAAHWETPTGNITSALFTGTAGWADIGTEIWISAREPNESALAGYIF